MSLFSKDSINQCIFKVSLDLNSVATITQTTHKPNIKLERDANTEQPIRQLLSLINLETLPPPSIENISATKKLYK